MRDPNKVVSARGELIDFDLIRIKEELAVAPTTVQREPKPARRRRKLSERGAALARIEEQTPEAAVDGDVERADPVAADADVGEEVEEAAPRIVRKKATK